MIKKRMARTLVYIDTIVAKWTVVESMATPDFADAW
jgi:hypothetical protein